MLKTLWESADLKPCAWCGNIVPVWDSSEARRLGENTIRMDWRDHPYIDPKFDEGYENVCSNCRKEDINFRYRLSREEYYKEKGLPIPKWIWGE